MTQPSDTPTSDFDVFPQAEPEPTPVFTELTPDTVRNSPVSSDKVLNTPLEAIEPEETPAEPEYTDTELRAYFAAENYWKWLEAETAFKARTVGVGWEHEIAEYEGDWLGIRIPSEGALTAFTLGTGEFTPDQTRQAMTSMFIQRHMSPTSYAWVFSRMMDPDDTYTDDMLGGLMKMLVEKSSEQIMADRKAEAEAAKVASLDEQRSKKRG